ncbi:hypothetical protein Tco_1290831 [Tanacetum coccineum]
MSIVVKMLEGALEVPDPLNPFSHLFSGVSESGDTFTRIAWNAVSDCSSSDVVTSSTVEMGTPIMKKYEITVALV